MNHSQRYKWVQDRLWRWGKWRVAPVLGIGYPTITAEARLTVSPGRSTKISSGPDYKLDPESKELDGLIAQILPRLQLALWLRYAQQVKTERACMLLEVESRDGYRGLLEQAERDLAKLIRAVA